MISKRPVDSLHQLVVMGASLEIDASIYGVDAIKKIALSLQPGATLKLFNTDKSTQDGLKAILLMKKGQITLA